jgi:Spy/CpxP family protein refolding chaperone
MRLHVALLCATALGLCASSALAQRPSGRGPARRAQLLLKGITLTPEQQARVDSIQTYYRQQMPSFTSGSPPDSATRQKVRGLFRHEVEDIRAVLTADQQKAFDKNLAELRQGRRGGP